MNNINVKEMVEVVDKFISDIMDAFHDDYDKYEELTSESIFVRLHGNEVEIPVNADTIEYLQMFLQNCYEDSIYNK